MSKRVTSGVVAAVVAVGMSVPAVGFANQGGKPHSTPPNCHTHKHFGQHRGNGPRNTKGNKCGIKPPS